MPVPYEKQKTYRQKLSQSRFSTMIGLFGPPVQFASAFTLSHRTLLRDYVYRINPSSRPAQCRNFSGFYSSGAYAPQLCLIIAA
jgi:hypothetical protein